MISKNLAPWERGLSVGFGGALLWLAARRRRGRLSTAMTGASLVARGVSGFCPVNAVIGRDSSDTRTALGGARGIRVRESVIVNRPVETVYDAWRDLSNLPFFMEHIESVETLPDGRTHWVVSGPGGLRLDWNAEIINDIPNELIAWRSLEGADVVSAGSVHFKPMRRGGTYVRVHLQYAPPAGRLGARIATLLGSNPAARIRSDLRGFKEMLEAGARPYARPDPRQERHDADVAAGIP